MATDAPLNQMKAHATTAIADTLARALDEHARALAKRAEAGVDGGKDAVRRARVASRRLREVLGIAGAAGVRHGVKASERDARRVTRAFGPVREIEVAFEELERASERHGWSTPNTLAIERRLERARAAARRPMVKAMRAFDGAALRARGSRIAKALAALPADRLWAALVARVARRADRVSRAIVECGTLYQPERLHRLRIAIKKLRYALEFVRDAPGIDVDAPIAALRDMQTRFGHLHDIHILAAEVEDLAVDSRRANPREGYVTEIEALEADCRRIHARLLPHLGPLQRHVAAVRRDLGVRETGRRLRMARADAATARRRAERPQPAVRSHG